MVEEFAADGSYPSFGECVRDGSPDWCFEDLDAFGPEDLIEAVDELAAPISDERQRTGESIGVTEEQVAGGLGCPRPVGLAVMPAR